MIRCSDAPGGRIAQQEPRCFRGTEVQDGAFYKRIALKKKIRPQGGLATDHEFVATAGERIQKLFLPLRITIE